VKKNLRNLGKNTVVGLFLGCLLLAAWVVFAAPAEQAEPVAQPSTPARDPERVLARVEGQEIREKDVDQLIQMTGPQGMMAYDNEQGRKAILDELIAARLFALSGTKQELDKTPEFKTLVDSFVAQALARAAIERSIESVTVTEEESRQFYDDNPDQFTTPEEIRARHILVNDDVTSADTIKAIQEELKKGISFDVLAIQHSTDPSAAQGGGDLGFFSRGQMVPEFETAAFALRELGDISGPVQSPFGWHIIKLEERKPSTLVSYEEMKPQIIQYLLNEKRGKKYQEELEALRTQYTIEKFDGTETSSN